jgi:Serine aminopeptidase, S33
MRAEKSTNGRSEEARAPWAWRAGLGALSAVAPALAARAAERMFVTPPHHAAPRRERAALSQAEALVVRAGGRTLRAWRFGEGPAVLLVHGWGGRGGQLAGFAPALGAAGLAAVAFDGPAHGASPGRTASVPELADAVAAVARAVGARAAIGHSVGAAAVGLAASRGLGLDAAVFLAPPRTPWRFLDAFCAALGIPPAVADRVGRRLEARVGVPRGKLDLAAAGARAGVPVLVAHDEGDAEVPVADGAAVAAGWDGAALLRTRGLGHQRILRDPEVIAAAVAFVAARVARCAGCGRPASTRTGERALCAGCALAEELFDRGGRMA